MEGIPTIEEGKMLDISSGIRTMGDRYLANEIHKLSKEAAARMHKSLSLIATTAEGKELVRRLVNSEMSINQRIMIKKIIEMYRDAADMVKTSEL